MSGLFRKLAAFAGLAALAAVATIGYAAKRFTTPAKVETMFLTPWELGIPYEDVLFKTEDGLALRGWWLPSPDARRTVVALAGHNSARQHLLGIGGALWRSGANVLLFDNRGRGTSEGNEVSLGYHERLDAEAAVEYALGRAPEPPLGLVGYSMGGAVALMVAAEDERVKAVVADSAFASQRSLLLWHLRRYVGPLSRPVFALARRFLDYDVREVEPVKAVGKISPRACLFIHGEKDRITDPDDSRAMFAAAEEPKEIWLLPEAAHVESYFLDREGYCRRVETFFEEHL